MRLKIPERASESCSETNIDSSSAIEFSSSTSHVTELWWSLLSSSVESSSKRGSKFGASLKMKALHAKEGISNKVGGLKDKFSKFKQRSSESVSLKSL